jgi:hypothetical protein
VDDKEFIIHYSLLASVLERAKDTKCFLPVPDNGMIGARVDSDAGIQAYANSPYFIAVLGKEIAKVNAELIRNSNYVVGMMNLLTSKWVEANVADGEGLVRLVGLSEHPNVIHADEKFNKVGRARWVTYDSGGSK